MAAVNAKLMGKCAIVIAETVIEHFLYTLWMKHRSWLKHQQKFSSHQIHISSQRSLHSVDESVSFINIVNGTVNAFKFSLEFY